MSVSENDDKQDDGLIPRKRSLVWTFFEKLNRYRVRCYLCQHEQNYQGTTGNILRHLKSKHDLDATIKGQEDPQNQERLRELCANLSLIMPVNQIKVEKKMVNKPCKRPFNEMLDMDHYKPQRESHTEVSDDNPFNNEEPFVNYMYRDPVSNDSWSAPRNDTIKKSKEQIDEERVLAETEYYRQKAGYFKLQKHLTALQAKKIRIEIEQMAMTNSNNLI